MFSLPNLRVTRNIPPRCLTFLNNQTVLDHLTRLEEISMNDSYYRIPAMPSADLFITINAYLKNQIKSLTIDVSSLNAWRDRYEDLVTVLSGFRTLKNLQFGDIGHSRTEEAINLTSIINACNRLVSLTLGITCKWRIDAECNIIHTSLSSLEVYVNGLTENHLEYMMHHLPNLKALTLYLFDNTFERALATADQYTVNQLAVYLKKMEYVEISALFEANGLNEALVISKLLNHLDVTVVWKHTC